MKKLLIILSLLVSLSGIAKPFNSFPQSENQRIESMNTHCKLKFTDAGLVSEQNATKDYLIYEVPGLTASELKASTLSTISSIYNSPKDVVTSLSDNMIQIEGYISRAYYSKAGSSVYPTDFSFTWTMQFKDGKIRINIPKITQIYVTGVPLMGTLKLDMAKPISVLIKEDSDRKMVVYKLNELITAICKNAKSQNDW